MRALFRFPEVRRGVLAISCAIWGHAVDNRTGGRTADARRQCRCGATYLQPDGRTTHVRHTLRCFLWHHTYVALAARGHVQEYVCVRCGHPLLLPRSEVSLSRPGAFAKRVRYRCGLFGHRVRAVGSRDGFVEYACGCGHSFLRPDGAAGTLRHPLGCVVRAHRIRFLTTRDGCAEYVCVDCGHPFCFTDMPRPTNGKPAATFTRAPESPTIS